MGRHARRLRRVRGVENKRAPGAREKKKDQEEQTSVDIHEEKFCQDEIDDFHESKEKLLLEGHLSDSEEDGLSGDEEEVMGWSEEGESEEEGEEFQLPLSLRRQFYASDEEDEMKGKEQPDISDKAWGRRKKAFYAVEGEDDLSGSEGSEVVAELEEKEAIALQQRMAAALKDSDFQAPALPVMDDNQQREVEIKEERVLQDLSKLSKEDKLALLERDSPELFDLLDDFDSRFSEAIHMLHPLVSVARDTSTITPKGREYLETKLQLNLIYCMNIMFYLHLKASRILVQSHPVIQRIVEIRQLIGRLEPLDDQLEGQLGTLLGALNNDKDEKEREDDCREGTGAGVDSSIAEEKAPEEPRGRKRPSPSLGDEEKRDVVEHTKETVGTEESSSKVEDPLAFYQRVAEQKRKKKRVKKERREGREGEGEGMEEEALEAEDGKRAVTYQISRNRGLIPQRKKELRNPRVKHRNKYRKALVKRKSQVHEVVTEVNRYGGESSGIRANVSHSIKIN